MNLSFIYKEILFLIISSWSIISFQDRSSPLIEQLTLFHDHSITIITLITVIVSYFIIILFYNSSINKFLLNEQTTEIIWTIIPAIILIFIAVPSLHLLYLLDEIKFSHITIKAIGHQWYWKYEYPEFNSIEFDSYIINSTNKYNSFRLLDVDNRVVLPFNLKIRVLISAIDVIHSWTVPSLGIKLDGVPGRLNQTNFLIKRPGLFYGQCSEICGANHSFIPIVIESLNIKSFINWTKK